MKSLSKKGHQGGFSLMEIMVVVGISSALALGTAQMMNTNQKLSKRSESGPRPYREDPYTPVE